MADETEKTAKKSEGEKREAQNTPAGPSQEPPKEAGNPQNSPPAPSPGTMGVEGPGEKGAQAEPLNFQNLEEEKTASTPGNMDFILDLPLKVSVQLGSSKILIKDLLQLGQGSVIELEKLAGEPMEVLVNGKLIARGEVVVVNEKFGVRLTDIVSPDERVKQLK